MLSLNLLAFAVAYVSAGAVLTAPFNNATLEALGADRACRDWNGSRDEAINCMNYLFNKDTTFCQTGNTVSQFCQAGRTQIIGVSVTGNNEKSYCKDVAYSVQWIINNCSNGDKVGGEFFGVSNVKRLCTSHKSDRYCDSWWEWKYSSLRDKLDAQGLEIDYRQEQLNS
jgi:hypothetical protein